MVYIGDITKINKQTNMLKVKGKVGKMGVYVVWLEFQTVSVKNATYTPGATMHNFQTNVTGKEKLVSFVRRHHIDFAKPVAKYALLFTSF